MQIGEFLDDGMTTYTGWFDKAADNAVFTYEQISGSGTITVEVVTKDHEDTGLGTALTDAFTQIGSTGFYTLELTNDTGTLKLKEQVRFKLSVTGEGGGALYRIHPPTWFNDAKATP